MLSRSLCRSGTVPELESEEEDDDEDADDEELPPLEAPDEPDPDPDPDPEPEPVDPEGPDEAEEPEEPTPCPGAATFADRVPAGAFAVVVADAASFAAADGEGAAVDPRRTVCWLSEVLFPVG